MSPKVRGTLKEEPTERLDWTSTGETGSTRWRNDKGLVNPGKGGIPETGTTRETHLTREGSFDVPSEQMKEVENQFTVEESLRKDRSDTHS